MIPSIRHATEEEINALRDKADLSNNCSVFALESSSGKTFAVVRQCYEIDPIVVEGEDTARRKAMMVFGLETGMTMLGISEYYFNVLPEDETYCEQVKKWGAEQVSVKPELRFKKVLRKNVQ